MIRFEISNPLLATWVAFGQTKDLVEATVQRTFTGLALSNEEYKVLLVLVNYPGMPRQREIAGWLDRSPSVVSELLTRMTTKGLITQTRDDGDRRRVRVAATEEGLRRFWEVSPVAWEMVSLV